MKISSVEDAEYTVNSHCRQRQEMKMGILEECKKLAYQIQSNAWKRVTLFSFSI
jgi:hypothetical protein